MNIALLLTPKSDTVLLKETMTLRQAMEKMEYHKYSAVPVIDESGHYVYTLSEGDILWFLKDSGNLSLKNTEDILISQIKRSREIEAISIDANLSHVQDMIRFQNFIPVIDDIGTFIGIVKRSDLMLSTMYVKDKVKAKKPLFTLASV